MKLLRGQPSGRVYVHGEFGKRWISPGEMNALMRAGYTLVDTPDAELKSIPNVPTIGGGGGTSEARVREIAQEEDGKLKVTK